MPVTGVSVGGGELAGPSSFVARRGNRKGTLREASFKYQRDRGFLVRKNHEISCSIKVFGVGPRTKGFQQENHGKGATRL